MSSSKYFIYLAGTDPSSQAAFQDSYLRAARKAAADAPHLGRLVVNLVGKTPAETPFTPATDTIDANAVRYDVIVEATPPAEVTGSVIAFLGSCLLDIAVKHVYRVEEVIQLDNQQIVLGERSPGIKYIGRLVSHPDMPDSAARRSWDTHVPLALKVHTGMAKYVRNWILGAADAPPACGIAELHFPTLENMIERYFDSERGKFEILHDIKHFIADGTRFHVSEYVLRG
ncbi:hypothetical protein [Microvirga puerhi]|uniref:EthD domain-containing protein n=1 Tax=Microvirga puerhi TaxID=2876078 RepID=A0ABS7VUI9_9HYPH|nr:hypothetical protein [Microvirga puerhi]MBZ6078720.1 hypothetical protein [Microvirga puerhi]